MSAVTANSRVSKAAPRNRLSDQAYDFLKSRLLRGELLPGATINIDEVIAAVNASKFPVMEALKRLEYEKFVEILPQVACRVATPSAEEVSEFLGLFAAVEGHFAQLAAERATDEDIDELTMINELLVRSCQRAKDSHELDQSYRMANRRFHRKLHDIGGASSINDLAYGLWDRGEFLINAGVGAVRFGTRMSSAVDEHREMIEAIRRHDGNLARDLATAHLKAFIAPDDAQSARKGRSVRRSERA